MIEVTTTYDLKFYTERVIKTAIRYYSSICNIQFHIEGDEGICCFKVDKKYADRVVYEFGNFLIELLSMHNLK